MHCCLIIQRCYLHGTVASQHEARNGCWTSASQFHTWELIRRGARTNDWASEYFALIAAFHLHSSPTETQVSVYTWWDHRTRTARNMKPSRKAPLKHYQYSELHGSLDHSSCGDHRVTQSNTFARAQIMNCQLGGIWLTHWHRVMHICVSTSSHHWIRKWLGACSAPRHYRNQGWLVVSCKRKHT